MVTQWVIATLNSRFGSFQRCQGLHDEDYNVLNWYICLSIWLKLLYIVTTIAGELTDGCLFCEWIIQIDIVCVMRRSRQCGQCIACRAIHMMGIARINIGFKRGYFASRSLRSALHNCASWQILLAPIMPSRVRQALGQRI